jgi:hypothetical protein
MESEIDLKGIPRIGEPVQTTVLTSAKPTDENSLTELNKVAPETATKAVTGPRFRHTFLGNSVTVLRAPAAPLACAQRSG